MSSIVLSMDAEGFRESVESHIRSASSIIRSARYLTAFTGAGISVESGIPPFRGPGGLWGKYDPRTLELDYFLADPTCAWPVIREIFCDNFGKARPNRAHDVLAAWEGRATRARVSAAACKSSSCRTSILCDETDRERSLILCRTGLRFPVT